MGAEGTAGRRIFIGALCWALTLEYFAAQAIAQLGWPGYSIRRYDISALGITVCGPFADPTSGTTIDACSPWHVVMNTGFVLLGVLTILGTVLLRPLWPRRRLTTIALTLLALSGLGEIMAGLAPGDVNLGIHAAGALLHWLCAGFGLLLLALAIRRTQQSLSLPTFLCALVVLVGFLLYGSQQYLGLGRGGMERLTAYPATLWMILVGVALLLAIRRGPLPWPAA